VCWEQWGRDDNSLRKNGGILQSLALAEKMWRIEA
jgi:hypothetical protein